MSRLIGPKKQLAALQTWSILVGIMGSPHVVAVDIEFCAKTTTPSVANTTLEDKSPRFHQPIKADSHHSLPGYRPASAKRPGTSHPGRTGRTSPALLGQATDRHNS